MSFTLAPEFWFRNDHVEFEQLVGLADGNLDATTREIIEIHLKICGTCPEDVQGFLAFRKQCAREMEVSYGPTSRTSTREAFFGLPWWRSLGRPAYGVAAIVLVAVALIIGASVLKRRSDPLEAKKNEPTQINVQAKPTPTESSPVILPSPSALEPSRSPDAASSPTRIDSTVVAVLKDGRSEVTIDKSGHVTGLDEISLNSRQEIAQASLRERIETPQILRGLTGEDSSLRGDNTGGRSFRLLYPARRVVMEDRPVFKWESVARASSYRVYVLDSKGNEIARSEELVPTETQWTAKTSLRRGEIYSWVVTGVVDGKEVVSPAASTPEMKFAVLATKDLQELAQLKKTRSHLALGVFYARAGLLTEAEREFRQLVQLNPQSQLPRKLLRSVRSLPESK